MTRLLTTLTALAAVGALAAGCGDDSDGGGSAAGGGGDYGGGAPAPAKTTSTAAKAPAAASDRLQLIVHAQETDGLAFDQEKFVVKDGKVTMTLENPGTAKLPHAIAIEGDGVDEDGEVVQPGGKSTVSVDLKPGTYTFYCPVGGHRAAGMEGTLTVS